MSKVNSRRPSNVGKFFYTTFMIEHKLSITSVSKSIGVEYNVLYNMIYSGHYCTPDIAARLAKFVGVNVGFFLDMQHRENVYTANQIDVTNIKTMK